MKSLKALRIAFGVALITGLMLLSRGISMATPPPPPDCNTSGPVGATSPSPSSYSYVRTAAGNTTGSFTVSPPTGTAPGNCAGAVVEFGNTENATEPVTVSVSGATDSSNNPVSAAILAAIQAAFSFSPNSFSLGLPPASQLVDFTFTNSSSIPADTYSVDIHLAPNPGDGVGAADTLFTLTVTEPTAMDTLPPDVTIVSPADNTSFLLNATLNLDCTATDPLEDGAGTGVQSMSATITSCGGTFSEDLTLTNNPALPVAAGVTTDATATATLSGIGSFTVTCTATDGASHTGSDEKSFSVGTTVTPLPPISVVGKVFKVGSTVPIKWQITNTNGNFLPPFTSISIVVTAPDHTTYTAVVGAGDSNIRWEVDADGNATQYITNYSPTQIGVYTVDVNVNDVCGNSAKQGSFTFTSSAKGGK